MAYDSVRPSLKYSSFAVCSVEVDKENDCNGDRSAKVVPPGTCFLGPVTSDRTFHGNITF